MADVETKICEIFQINELNCFQKAAITTLVEKRKDVFVNLPTGCGKSLIYQCLTTVYSHYNPTSHAIVIVVSPLISLMKDQVDCLNKIGIKSVSLSHISNQDEYRAVEKGEYSIVYG